MSAFLASLAAFVAIHVGLSGTGFRGVAIRAIGEGPYRGLFSAASIALLVAVILTYEPARAGAGAAIVWIPPDWTRHLAHLIMLIAFVIAFAGLLTPGPTLAGFEGALAKPEPAKGILRVTRHPFLVGVVLWSGAHLLVNGELAAMILFAGLGLTGLLGMGSIDRKTRARDPEGWERFAACTSTLPFAAILQGRNRLNLSEMWWRLILALAAFGAAFWAHGAVFGVSVT